MWHSNVSIGQSVTFIYLRRHTGWGEGVGNAVTYAAADLPRWVEVGYEDVVPPDAGQQVRAFYVRDNGTGIWAEQQQHVARLLDEPGARGRGAGAGLTISRRIVERHGGRMWVRSAPDQGTTCYFTV
jgi:two-component system, chemotaxis family, sensor kinase Cph1